MDYKENYIKKKLKHKKVALKNAVLTAFNFFHLRNSGKGRNGHFKCAFVCLLIIMHFVCLLHTHKHTC